MWYSTQHFYPVAFFDRESLAVVPAVEGIRSRYAKLSISFHWYPSCHLTLPKKAHAFPSMLNYSFNSHSSLTDHFEFESKLEQTFNQTKELIIDQFYPFRSHKRSPRMWWTWDASRASRNQDQHTSLNERLGMFYKAARSRAQANGKVGLTHGSNRLLKVKRQSFVISGQGTGSTGRPRYVVLL